MNVLLAAIKILIRLTRDGKQTLLTYKIARPVQ